MPWAPCVNSRDTITQDDGLILQNFRVLDGNQHTVTSHCRDANGTWITWFDNTNDSTWSNTATGYNDIDTWTGNTFPVHVAYFPDDGSGATIYDLAVNYIWAWRAGARYAAVSSCAIHFPDSTKYFGNNVQCELVGWNTGVRDVQVRTDGTNVWVVVLAQESVMYPWLWGYTVGQFGKVDRCGTLHLKLFDVALREGCRVSGSTIDGSLASDGNAAIHDTTGDGSVPGGGTWWEQTGVIGIDNPDDAGLHSSFRWQPARVTVFGGDLGGFTLLGGDDAQYFNNSGTTSTGIGIGLCSGIEVAASPAEPGVCHVLWSEAGPEQQFLPSLGQRISYSRWSPTDFIMQSDLARRGPQTTPPNGFTGTGEWAWTAEMILRNDHGAPAAIVLPWQISSEDDTGFIGSPGPPQYWDLSSGTAVVVQEMDPSFFPTSDEAGMVSPPSPAGGLLTDEASDYHRRQFASSLYTDPTLGNVDVYLIRLGFFDSAGGVGGGTTDAAAMAFYRIPADGSATFDFMDGTRLPMYSILPAIPFQGEMRADFVSDPGNVWMPAQAGNTAVVLHLPRTCTRTWEQLDAFPDVDAVPAWVHSGSFALAPTSPPSIVTDDTGEDWLAAGGLVPPAGLDPTMIVAALRARICRCCVPCIERIGLHIWEKV